MVCPKCGVELTSLTEALSIIDDTPKPDDITLCDNCGAICIVKKDITLREMTIKEIEELRKKNPKLVEVILKKIRE